LHTVQWSFALPQNNKSMIQFLFWIFQVFKAV
jgi:hypothetical protein